MEQNIVEKILPQVPKERSITSDQEYNLVIVANIDTTNAFTGKKTFVEMLNGDFDGMGKVDIVALDLKYKMTAANQTVKAGVFLQDTSLTIDQLVGLEGVLNHTSTSYNYGETKTAHLIIPDLVSAQVQPPSGVARTAVVYYNIGKNVECSMIFKLRHHGPKYQFKSLN
nr:MAG: ORF2 protein [Armillaria ostoyae RNA virus 1]